MVKVKRSVPTMNRVFKNPKPTVKKHARIRAAHVGRTFAVVYEGTFWLLSCTRAVVCNSGSAGIYGHQLLEIDQTGETLTVGQPGGAVYGCYEVDDTVVDVTDLIVVERGRLKFDNVVLRERCGGAVHDRSLAESQDVESHEAFDDRREPDAKKIMNSLLRKEAAHWQASAFEGETLRALVLDGKETATAAALMAGGVAEADIQVANDCAGTVFRIMEKRPALNVRFGTVGEFLTAEREPFKEFGLVYLDYCGTWRGNADCCPREDLEALFARGHLADRCVLAYTFCKRSPVHDRFQRDNELAWRCLQDLCLRHGWELRATRSVHYGQMWSACFRLCRRPLECDVDWLMADIQ